MSTNNKSLKIFYKILYILVIIKLILLFVNYSVKIYGYDLFNKNNKYIEVDKNNYKYKKLDFNKIYNIKIIDSAKVILKENKDCDKILIKYYDSDDLKYNIDVKDDTLMLKNTNLKHKYKNLELNILLPKKILKNIDINNKNGDVDIDSYKSKNVIIKNTNGNANIKIDSNIFEIKNKNGNIKISNNSDDVKIKNTNGNINFSGNSNKIKIGNNNGNVYFNGVSNDIKINNMNGKINCDIKGNKDDYNINFKTVNGFTSINNIKIDKNNKDLNINKNKNTNKNLNLKTFNGNISIIFL